MLLQKSFQPILACCAVLSKHVSLVLHHSNTLMLTFVVPKCITRCAKHHIKITDCQKLYNDSFYFEPKKGWINVKYICSKGIPEMEKALGFFFHKNVSLPKWL